MAEWSYPQDGILVGDATQAPYDADEFALHFQGNLLGFARRANSGPVAGYDDGTHYSLEVNQTSVASANVTLRVGAGVVRGTAYENDADLTLAVGGNASGNPRIDTVILRKDYTLQTVRAAILQGAAAASPVPPTLTQVDGSVWEIPIADIAVSNGFSTITDANVTPRHDWVNVGNGTYIDKVLNNSGATLEDGDVVIWDTGADKAAITTTTANHGKAAGVWRGRIANAAYGRLQTKGWGAVRLRLQNISVSPVVVARGSLVVTGNAARFGTIISYDTAAVFNSIIGTPNTSRTNLAPVVIGQLGTTITVPASTTLDVLAWVYIDVNQQRNPLHYRIYESGGANGGTFTNGAMRTRTLNVLKVNDGQDISSVNETNPYVSLATNTFTLQQGVYYIRASAPAYRVDGHQIKLQEIGGAALVFAYGTAEYSPSAVDGAISRSTLECKIVVNAARSFQIQHQCTTTRATDGLGKSPGLVGQSIYTVVEIMRFAEFQ